MTITNLCPSSIVLNLPPHPVSIAKFSNGDESRTLETLSGDGRTGSEVVIKYYVTFEEANHILKSREDSLSAYLEWELSETFKGYIGLDPNLYEFYPVWRHENEPISISLSNEGFYELTLKIYNIRR